jgi:diguanylate cyclase (GGDEF)-like protein
LIVIHYDTWIVVLSLLIAIFASYVAIDLAQRVRSTDRALARVWWGVGSLAMGTGIWSMHFVGMQAADFPFDVGFNRALTAGSWVVAVAASAVTLGIASRARLSARRLAVGALSLGLGICAMHYMGMAAMRMSPGIGWSSGWVLASVGIAIAASAAALVASFGMRRLDEGAARGAQALGAVVMGAGIWGMHYSGMAAANFATGSVCTSATDLHGNQLGLAVALSTIALLAITTFTSSIDARMQRKAAVLADSLRQANDELQRLVFRDVLTGLPNRHLLEDRIQAAVERCARGGGSFFLLLIDIDGFKQVNDSFGHHFGDAALCRVAARIVERVRAVDTVARLGGDEFVVLIEGDGGMAAAQISQRIVEAISERIAGEGCEVRLSCSIGVAMFPSDGPRETLMAHAGDALHAAKRAGGGRCVFFAPHMNAGARAQIELHNDLRHAIEHGELELHYQPKVRARDGAITGVEALARWPHAARGMVSPATFIPIAERFGLIEALGDWVLEEACRQIARWRRQGLSLRVAVNVSVHQLRRGDFDDRVARLLEAYALDPSVLVLEVTESAAMEDVEGTQAMFERLGALGVALSIDDFGTGYSSLSYLRRLKVRQLKIDRSFVCDLESSTDARVIVKAVVNLAHALHLDVVAEGVETAAQRDVLTAMDCDELQGYFHAKPMPAEALRQWTLDVARRGAVGVP